MCNHVELIEQPSLWFAPTWFEVQFHRATFFFLVNNHEFRASQILYTIQQGSSAELKPTKQVLREPTIFCISIGIKTK